MIRAVLATLTLALGILAVPAAAQAAWFWSEDLAEDALEQDYNGVINAYCYGRGNWTRTDSGLKGFRHFRCYTDMTDGSEDTGRFHVRGKWRYSFYWG